MTTTDKEFKGAAVQTTITNTINASDTAVSIASATGWPTGAQPFTVIIDRGQSTEEKVYCTARSGTSLTLSQRGYDDTSAGAHLAGVTIEHCIAATDFDALFNHATNTSLDDHTQYLKTTTAASTYETSTHAAATYASARTVQTDFVATNESTTSNGTPVNLTTAGPAVTITVPASGKVRVDLYGQLTATGSQAYAQMFFALTGANTVSADQTRQLFVANSSTSGDLTAGSGGSFVVTGLTPGSTTFTTKYCKNGGTSASFSNRRISVETLP